jgi:glycosyltransferase involved in cell wall biosynthesis
MKIGIDAQKLNNPRPTGTERYSADVIRGLIEVLAPRDELTLYLRANNELDDHKKKLHKKVIRWPRLWTLGGLSVEMLLHRPDRLFVPAHVLPLVYPKQSVVTIHDVAFRHIPAAYSRKSRLYQEWSTKRAIKRAARIICVSENTKKDLIELFKAPEDKLRMVYPGFEPNGPETIDLKKRDQLLHTLRLAKGEYFLFVGRVEEKKNLLRLVTAFNAARKGAGLKYRLVLAGSPGKGLSQLKQLVSKLGLSGEVVFPGYIDEETKHYLLSSANSLVLPSLYEGFGYPILEAYAAGVPVVASRVSAIPEVAGKGALLFDPENVEELRERLVQVATNQALRADLVKSGASELRRFDFLKSSRDILAVIKEKGPKA